MLVVIGSKNPVKISGVEKAFREVFNNVVIKSVGVDNIVGKQPIGFDEIYIGAYSRALNASKKISGGDFYVGVEAGIVNIHGYWMDTQMTFIMDKKGRVSIGLSQTFPIPKNFVNEILFNKTELEDIVNKYYGTEKIGEKGGFIQILTKNRVLREDLVYNATIVALIPWINKDLFSENSTPKNNIEE